MNTIETAPRDVKILIYAPSFSRRPITAMLSERKGCKGLRWKIFNFCGANRPHWAGSQFKPIGWEPWRELHKNFDSQLPSRAPILWPNKPSFR